MNNPYIDKNTKKKLLLIEDVVLSNTELLNQNFKLKLRLEKIAETIQSNLPLNDNQLNFINRI